MPVNIEKQQGLKIPHKVWVYPKTGGKPFMTTRWRNIPVNYYTGDLKFVDSKEYTGDLQNVYKQWIKFLQGYQGQYRKMLPVIALQEILSKNSNGLLAVSHNRIVGIATYTKDNQISIISSSLFEMDTPIESFLVSSLKQELKNRNILVDEPDAMSDSENNFDDFVDSVHFVDGNE
ncbi:hypothetical protein HYS94_01885 [Candidatus Daviesbacteria bacterium]|nr:hypothetical protein [Candidatus Daviesbacteria bacterium]